MTDREIKNLDYKKMIEEIDILVDTDWGEEMSLLANITTNGKYKEISQEDARAMANVIGQVYLISHSLHCSNCCKKYKLKD